MCMSVYVPMFICMCGDGMHCFPLSLCHRPVWMWCVRVWLRADVSQWSGKLQQTYSCRLTLWLIWSVISPVFHFNRCDHSAVAGLSDLIKINSGVTGLPTEQAPPPPKSLSILSVEKPPSLPSISTCKSSLPLISQLTHLDKFHNLHRLVVITTART